MKKIILGCIAALSLTNAIAQPQICPFMDRFTISAPTAVAITGLEFEGNLSGIIADATHFELFCKDNSSTKNGHAYLSVGTDANHCKLTIADGPFEMNPSVTSINCTGNLNYVGIDHELGTYRYKLKFS